MIQKEVFVKKIKSISIESLISAKVDFIGFEKVKLIRIDIYILCHKHEVCES